MQLLRYLQPIVQNIKEVKIISSSVDVENNSLLYSINEVFNNQFIPSTKEDGISLYEKMLRITPETADTLDDRKLRILSHYNKQLPYTKTVLEQNLTTLCGKDGYKIIYDLDNYRLVVKIDLKAKSMINTVQNYLENVVPLNLVIDLILLYNTHEILSKFTHEQLSQYINLQLREEVFTNVNANNKLKTC